MAGLEDSLDAFENLCAQLSELCAAMVERWVVDRA
jgi:hypothetical protein